MTQRRDLGGRNLLQFLAKLARAPTAPTKYFMTSAAIFSNVFVAAVLVSETSQKVFATEAAGDVGNFVLTEAVLVLIFVLARFAVAVAFFADRSGT